MWTEVSSRKKGEDRKRVAEKDSERDDECGICMENCTKLVLPNCGHALCISCFHEWNVRSQSCPFCRGSLKRVKSKDLWVLTSCSDILDVVTLAKENLWRLYLYFEKLPLVMPETHSYVSDYMI
ncbi:peroxisome bioproteinsis factor 10-like isoform X2 [Hibiscus syriacus]|uniref:Peroxisome bioproteinsis factor 10-like isoform X2 n=1 Tax=Hibiscus syriacus TaxID=106335 RepID=A0A6A2Z6T2_HIBSY|nr:peroxisome bioproteinsis factor 10-like isoform X2 [Hibiscus syriacus]